MIEDKALRDALYGGFPLAVAAVQFGATQPSA
jgi:hypothetical protein